MSFITNTIRHRKALRENFPEMTLELVRSLEQKNRRRQRIPQWRVRQFENFVIALNAAAFELERARHEGRTATLAWAARNSLELSIWTAYCCASAQNAKRFKDDTKRDTFGMIASVKRVVKTPEQRQEVDTILQSVEKMLNTRSFKVSDDFRRVGEAAAELGREGEFLGLNKFFSKMAHPTAFVVNRKKKIVFDKPFQAAIFIIGVGLAFESMVTLTDFVENTFPDPSLKRQLNKSRP